MSHVFFVVGATASGKSALSFELASKLKSSAIINCDSIQLYQKVDIGSAKPSKEEQKQVPHLLYDVVAPPNEMTAGEYRTLFFKTLKENPYENYFVVGGTGFYFLAIEKGMFDIGPAHPEIKKEVEDFLKTPEGPRKLYEELKGVDPETAQKLSPNDHYRIGRAIEIWRSHQIKPSDVRKMKETQVVPFPYPLTKIAVRTSKEEILGRVQQRTENMFKDGFVEEVRDLLNQDLGSWAPLESVGYREVKSALQQSTDLSKKENLETLKKEIVQSTMKLVKKQKTWFQRDTDIEWFDLPSLPSKAEEFIRRRIDATRVQTSV